MTKKIILLILFLFVDFVFLQKPTTKVVKKSLLLVADVTGSMTSDIAQLRESCTEILDNFYSRDTKPITNYVLSLFRDPKDPSNPAIEPIINTTNPSDIKSKLGSVPITGGGDCPESSLTGIKRALPYALSNSLVYVFTDADSNDYELENEIKTILRTKQISVTFFLTGKCTSDSAPGQLVYKNIASETGGQVLNMNKQTVKEVLSAISDQLEEDFTPIESVEHEAGTHNEALNVDSTVTKLIISVNGDGVTLSGTDPHNITHSSKPLGSKGQIMVVPDPIPGQWEIVSSAVSPYKKSTAGLSEVNFDYGFSFHKTSNKNATTYQPIMNKKNYLQVFVSNPEEVKSLTKVELILLDNSRDQWNLHKENDALYSTQWIDVPKQAFKMSLIGIDKKGMQIKRILSTTVIQPVKPVYKDMTDHDVKELENLLKNWRLTDRAINLFKDAGIKVEELKTISEKKLNEVLASLPPTAFRKVKGKIETAFKTKLI